MLRVYKPENHAIFSLHKLLKHVVVDVWCEACDDACDDKLEEAFKKIYHYSYKSLPKVKKTLKDEIERIYAIFKTLESDERKKIAEAFTNTNEIENLCNGKTPIYLSELPEVIEKDIKPLFEWFYVELLGKAKVAGNKLKYYQHLIKANNFQDCPCCGLIGFESFESKYREAYDHYLPKSKYPFASVNFQNLVPLCYKCNSDRKKAKDPIEGDRKVFYPFSTDPHHIDIELVVDTSKDLDKLTRADVQINFVGDKEKIETWDWLFDISDRYNDRARGKIHGWVRKWITRYRRSKRRAIGISMSQIIDEHIEDYEPDKYEDLKFLQIAFLKALKKDVAFLAVYD